MKRQEPRRSLGGGGLLWRNFALIRQLESRRALHCLTGKMPMTTPILSLNKVSKFYNQAGQDVVVLHDVTVRFEYGKTYAVTGVSGSGKSTLIHILAGLDVPTTGAVLFNGVDINQLSHAQKASFLNTSIGLAFQYPYLIKELSVLENVKIKGMIAGIPKDACTAQAQDLLHKVGLEDRVGYYPGQLSGGQQQRVALARALMNNPSFLITDEPTANLDQQTGQMIIDLIIAIQKEKGMGVIISSHDRYITERMEQVFVLNNGLLIAQR